MNNQQIPLSKRIKKYQSIYNYKVIPKIPVIVKINEIDKKYHTSVLSTIMHSNIEALEQVASELCLKNTLMIYCFDGEINILLKNNFSEDDISNDMHLLLTTLLSLVTAEYNIYMHSNFCSHLGRTYFEGTIFQLPKEEVTNYFIYRQSIANTNTLTRLAYQATNDESVAKWANSDKLKAINENLEKTDMALDKMDSLYRYGFYYRYINDCLTRTSCDILFQDKKELIDNIIYNNQEN